MLNLSDIKKYKLPLILLVAGILLFGTLSVFKSEDSKENRAYVTDETVKEEESYDIYIEEKLEKILGSTEGVGKVKVAVSLLDSGEIYPFTKEENSEEITGEKDSEGGSRDKESTSSKSEASFTKESDGSEELVITKSHMPNISGVIVCAQGGDSFVVKERIVKAVKALCNIDINRIEILPMKQNRQDFQ